MLPDNDNENQSAYPEFRITTTHHFIYKTIVFAFVLVALVFCRGWTSIRYDKGDNAVGNHYIFKRQMVLTEIEPGMVHKAISKRYRSMIHEKTQWSVSSAWHPEVMQDEIRCGEVFVVSEVFYTVPHGILELTFSPGKEKVYVLSSDRYKDVVISDYLLAAYSSVFHSQTDKIRCD